MTKLGVEISPFKTHISKDTYEFAKRWIKSNKEISGISLKGILSNIQNIKIVYLNIFTYIQRIPQSSPYSSLVIICKLYSNLPINGRCKSYKSLYMMLYDFSHSLRFSFGLITYDELRSYLVKKTLNNPDFAMPSETLIHKYMKVIISEALTVNAKNSVNNVLAQFDSLQNKFKEHIDVNELSNWPIISGYINHLNSMSSIIRTYESGNISLVDSALAMNFQSVDKIINMNRNKLVQVNALDKL
jgi:hypothetical protein